MKPSSYRNFLHYSVLVLIFGLGLGLHIWGAWCLARGSSPDHGIFCLMAKHIAEGRDWPVFFYGQSYMGSFEAFASAFFCWLLGPSQFSVNLGTVVFSFLLLPIIYLWGRLSSGKRGALAATLFCAIGPPAYFQYACWPTGAYNLVLLSGSAIITAILLAAARPQHQFYRSARWLFGIGILAGLGWWGTQLIVAALATAAITYIIVYRSSACRPSLIISGSLGFFIGSLPFWLWNIDNNWRTFLFFQDATHGPLLQALQLFASERLPEILGLRATATPPLFIIAAAAAYLSLFILSLVLFIAALRQRSPKAYGIGAALLLLVMMTASFCLSQFAFINTVRYLLPIIPVAAIIIGIGTEYLTRKSLLGWLPLALIIAAQLTALPTFYAWRLDGERLFQRFASLGEFLREHKIQHLYAPYLATRYNHSLNFNLHEEFVFADPTGERYEPYRIETEATSDIAILHDIGRFQDFVRLSGGSNQLAKTGETSVSYDIKPPPAETAILGIGPVLLNTSNITKLVTIPRLGTYCQITSNDWLEITIPPEETVAALRLIGKPTGARPMKLLVKGLKPDGLWTNLAQPAPVTSWYWTARRPYWDGRLSLPEIRFSPGRYEKILIKSSEGYDLSGLQVFRPADSQNFQPGNGLLDLTGLLLSNKIDRMYGDRWLANAIEATSCMRVKSALAIGHSLGPAMVKLTPTTAIIVNASEAPGCQKVLGYCGIETRTATVANWVVFYFSPAAWQENYRACSQLVWYGKFLVIGP